jgi:zinc protease
VTQKAALVAAFLFALPGLPAAAAQRSFAPLTPEPSLQPAPSGMMYGVLPDPAQPTAAVSLWYRAPAAGFDVSAPAGPSHAATLPGLSRLAALTVAASTPITGTPLARLVQSVGGRFSVSTYPDSVAITILVSPEHVNAVVRAVTADYFAPVIDAAGFALAQRDVAEDAIYRSYDPPDAVEDALESALFSDGPFHDGTIVEPKTIAALTIDHVRAYAERAFRPANAILILTGNVDASAIDGAATRDGALPSPELLTRQSPASPGPAVQHTANVEGTGLGWAGPAISDEASATALDFTADALFAPKTGIVQRALGALNVEVTGKFVTYHDPGLFLVTISGADAKAALPIVQRAIAHAASPMNAAVFASARAGFEYRLLSDLETPAELADTFGWYAVEGNFAYAPAGSRYFHVAAELTPQIVARTVARYLTASPAVVTLVRARPAATSKPS